jgi:hypothetical protein
MYVPRPLVHALEKLLNNNNNNQVMDFEKKIKNQHPKTNTLSEDGSKRGVTNSKLIQI